MTGIQSTQSSTTSNKAVIEQVLAAFARGDLEGVTKGFNSDSVARQAPSLPYGGEHHGHDEFIAMVMAIGATFELQTHSHAIYEACDLVALRLDLTFTSRATGRSARVPAVELYSFRDNLISGVEIYYQDTKAVLDLLDN
jgi:ketosteroid isomerase-like protein